MLETPAMRPRTAFEPAPRLGWTVVAAKMRASRNRLAVTRRKSPVLTSLQFGFAVPGTVAFVALLSVAFASAFSTLKDEGLATTLLASVLTMGSIGAFIGSSTTALQALYLADDIPFLLTLPIPLRVLFGSKFVEAAVGAVPPSLLTIAGMIGYGLTRADQPGYWLLAAAMVVSSIVLSTSVAVVVVSVVARFIPPKRAKLFLFGISMAVISATMFGWRLLAPRPAILGDVVEHREYDTLWRALASLPAGWSAQSLSDFVSGSYSSAAILAGLDLAAAIALLGFASAVFQKTFIHGLSRTTATQTGVPSESLSAWLTRLAGYLPQRFGAMVLREWLLLARDLRRLSGVMWPLGVVLVYTVLIGRNSGTAFASEQLSFWSKNGTLALLPWGLSLGISVYSYGSEGRNIHLLRSLPTSGAAVFAAKVLASALPIAAVTLGASITSLWFRQAPLDWSMELLAVELWMVLGYVAIDTSAAAVAPNFEAANVQRTITLTGRLFSFAFGGVFGLATLTLVGRFVLTAPDIPAAWSRVLHTRIAGIEPLGWPLVLAAAGLAVGSVIVSTAVAIRQTARLMQSEP